MCQAMTIAITTVLPVPVAILAHIRRNSPPSPGMSRPRLVAFPGFGQPYQRLGGLELAEEKPADVKFLRVGPVIQQALGDGGYAGIPGLAPSLHPLPDLIDQRDFDEYAGVIENP